MFTGLWHGFSLLLGHSTYTRLSLLNMDFCSLRLETFPGIPQYAKLLTVEIDPRQWWIMFPTVKTQGVQALLYISICNLLESLSIVDALPPCHVSVCLTISLGDSNQQFVLRFESKHLFHTEILKQDIVFFQNPPTMIAILRRFEECFCFWFCFIKAGKRNCLHLTFVLSFDIVLPNT